MFDFLTKLRKKYFPTDIEITKSMIDEWIEIFPDKCLICSYHDFGLREGCTREPKPKAHTCCNEQSKAT